MKYTTPKLIVIQNRWYCYSATKPEQKHLRITPSRVSENESNDSLNDMNATVFENVFPVNNILAISFWTSCLMILLKSCQTVVSLSIFVRSLCLESEIRCLQRLKGRSGEVNIW